MPRRPRIEIPGGFYHVVTRGNNKQPIFDNVLRAEFLTRATVVANRYDWIVYAWALMTNHFHLVFQLASGGLSRGMCELNGGFARAANAHLDRTDHCFGRRFWHTPLETDQHLLASIRYAAWNPARAGLGDHPVESRWTSFRASAGLDPAPPLLATDRLLELFGPTQARGRDTFAQFVADGRKRCLEPWKI